MPRILASDQGEIKSIFTINEEPPEEDEKGSPMGSDREDEEEEDAGEMGEMDLEGWSTIEQVPFKSSRGTVGVSIACKFDAKGAAIGGWARGGVKSPARTGPNCGMYGVKFAGDQLISFLELPEIQTASGFK